MDDEELNLGNFLETLDIVQKSEDYPPNDGNDFLKYIDGDYPLIYVDEALHGVIIITHKEYPPRTIILLTKKHPPILTSPIMPRYLTTRMNNMV